MQIISQIILARLEIFIAIRDEKTTECPWLFNDIDGVNLGCLIVVIEGDGDC